MMIQYLVGLCCYRHDPDAVEITLGDMIYDEAAQKSRDVDVTVMFKDKDGELTAFKAAEVKKESHPLDVITVEQLCLKFLDMPQITHRSIFSTSGYTDAAKRKTKYHSVELYTLKPWNYRIENDFPDFNGVGTPQEFLAQVDICLVNWVRYSIYLTVPEGPEKFQWHNDMPIFCSPNKLHDCYKNLGEYISMILYRSANILCMNDEVMKKTGKLFVEKTNRSSGRVCGQAFDFMHTMDIVSDSIYLQFADEFHQVSSLTIAGQLQWHKKKRELEFYILENEETKEIFAGAAIADYGEGDGRMFANGFP